MEQDDDNDEVDNDGDIDENDYSSCLTKCSHTGDHVNKVTQIIEDIFDDSLLEDSSDVSINSTGYELFKTSSLNQINEKINLEELLVSFSNNEDLNQVKSFIF